MSDTKHKNPMPCGCGIKGTPTLDDFGNSMHYANLFIDFCPMHKAAPDLLEACKQMLQAYGGGQCIETEKIARKAIAKAKGRESNG